jgi:rubrerythrin
MGSGAEELLEVLTGFIEEELGDQRAYQAMLRQTPSWARQRIRDLAAEEGNHAKRLMAVYYLITGKCYHPAIPTNCMYMERWCVALRERYHEAACNGLNYARTADETTDLCLSRLLQELSGEEYRHADLVLGLLQRSLRG